jgi:hypothetical protein
LRRPTLSTSRAALCACLGLCLWPVTPALAWWNCTWSNRVPLDVSASAAASNAIVEATFDATALPGYAWGGTDADLRIVDADDQTLLPHWSEPRPGNVQRLHVFFRVPSVGPAARRVYAYYGNAAATSVSNAGLFGAPGVRLLTKQMTAGVQTTLQGFYGAFDAAAQPAGYGCAVLPDYVNESNVSRFGAGTNAHYSVLFFLDVPASQAGTWRFRLGPDFGYGGALYVDGTTLQSAWGTDLWWAGNWANTAQLLQGSVTLAAGRHFVAAYGSEGCCEGLQAMQADVPGGGTNYVDLTTANFTLVAPSCPLAGQALVRVADSGNFAVSQAVATVSDPVLGATNAKSIPGARKRWTVRVADAGNARAVDSNSVQLVVPVPAGTRLFVGDLGATGSGPVRFVDGSPSSGLTYAYASLASTTDDLAFSNDGGATWTYVPVPNASGIDANVTHVRVSPRGKPQCSATATPAGFSLEFDTSVQ